mgnify:CR=1 FL=1
MKDFEVIDVHVHLARTVEEESNSWIVPGRRACDRWATPEKVISYMDSKGISKIVFLALIPRQFRGPLIEKAKLMELNEDQHQRRRKEIAEQIASSMREFNEWSCEVGRRFPRISPFICVSNDLGNAKAMVQEVVLRANQGAKGVKLHPGMFCFFPDDEEFWPMYEKCQQLGLPILADSGPWPHSHVLTTHPLLFQMPQPHISYGEPRNFARVLEAFPQLTLILAHLGSAWWDERVELAEKYPNVYFDTAQGFSAPDRIPVVPHRSLAEEDAVRVMRKIGIERIMFGTDSPAIAPQPQLEQLLRLPLSKEEKRMILAENAKRILPI